MDLEKATSSGCLPWSLEASKVGKLHLFQNLSHHWAMFGLDTLAVSEFLRRFLVRIRSYHTR